MDPEEQQAKGCLTVVHEKSNSLEEVTWDLIFATSCVHAFYLVPTKIHRQYSGAEIRL